MYFKLGIHYFLIVPREGCGTIENTVGSFSPHDEGNSRNLINIDMSEKIL